MKAMLCLFLTIAAVTRFSVGQGVYYVKPTPEYPCSQQPCDTLSGYMESNYIFRRDSSRNITMMFLLGVHNVSKSWIITNIHNLTLEGQAGAPSNLSARIKCISQAYFKFTDIHALEINGLSISHCGVTAETTAMVIFAQNLHTLLITNSYFFGNLYGSAIYAIKTKEMVVTNSLFDGNSASNFAGGAITVLVAEKLEISNSTFTNNNCSRNGGAIYLDRILIILITNSNFVNNSAYTVDCKIPTGCSNGGAISVFGYGQDAYFNPAKVTRVVFDGHIVFENNFAQGSGGGCSVAYVTFVHFLGKTVFYNNTAYLAEGEHYVFKMD